MQIAELDRRADVLQAERACACGNGLSGDHRGLALVLQGGTTFLPVPAAAVPSFACAVATAHPGRGARSTWSRHVFESGTSAPPVSWLDGQPMRSS